MFEIRRALWGPSVTLGRLREADWSNSLKTKSTISTHLGQYVSPLAIHSKLSLLLKMAVGSVLVTGYVSTTSVPSEIDIVPTVKAQSHLAKD